MIIGFSGHLGSGKNYVAENVFLPLLYDMCKDNEKTKNHILMPYFFSFGDHIKVECLCREPYNILSSSIGYNNYFINKDQTTRMNLQKYGTENGRYKYHNDVWVRAVETWIMIQTERLLKFASLMGTQYIPIFIISDVRFMNEAKYIVDHNGILIRINAKNRSMKRLIQESNNNNEIIEKITSHISETELDNYTFKYIVDNDTDNHEYLEQQIRNIINQVLLTNNYY